MSIYHLWAGNISIALQSGPANYLQNLSEPAQNNSINGTLLFGFFFFRIVVSFKMHSVENPATLSIVSKHQFQFLEPLRETNIQGWSNWEFEGSWV